MTLNAVELGRRLSEARSFMGFTQDHVAISLGLHRTAIVQIEAGRRGVSTLELAEFAKLYRKPVADFFQEGRPASRTPWSH